MVSFRLQSGRNLPRQFTKSSTRSFSTKSRSQFGPVWPLLLFQFMHFDCNNSREEARDRRPAGLRLQECSDQSRVCVAQSEHDASALPSASQLQASRNGLLQAGQLSGGNRYQQSNNTYTQMSPLRAGSHTMTTYTTTHWAGIKPTCPRQCASCTPSNTVCEERPK